MKLSVSDNSNFKDQEENELLLAQQLYNWFLPLVKNNAIESHLNSITRVPREKLIEHSAKILKLLNGIIHDKEYFILINLLKQYMSQLVDFRSKEENEDKIQIDLFKATSLYRESEIEPQTAEEFSQIIRSTRGMLLVLGNKTRETAFVLEHLDSPIPKWLTPQEKKATDTRNIPNDPFKFYETHYQRVKEYMSQAVLKAYDPKLRDAIISKTKRLKSKSVSIEVREIVAPKPSINFSSDLFKLLSKNLQIQPAQFYQTVRSICSALQRDEYL